MRRLHHRGVLYRTSRNTPDDRRGGADRRSGLRGNSEAPPEGTPDRRQTVYRRPFRRRLQEWSMRSGVRPRRPGRPLITTYQPADLEPDRGRGARDLRRRDPRVPARRETVAACAPPTSEPAQPEDIRRRCAGSSTSRRTALLSAIRESMASRRRNWKPTAANPRRRQRDNGSRLAKPAQPAYITLALGRGHRRPQPRLEAALTDVGAKRLPDGGRRSAGATASSWLRCMRGSRCRRRDRPAFVRIPPGHDRFRRRRSGASRLDRRSRQNPLGGVFAATSAERGKVATAARAQADLARSRSSLGSGVRRASQGSRSNPQKGRPKVLRRAASAGVLRILAATRDTASVQDPARAGHPGPTWQSHRLALALRRPSRAPSRR
jgi:hypothetical protein